MHASSFNPYRSGNPVRGAHFFGREKLLAAIVADLRSPDVTAVTVRGQRRVGKSSILTRLFEVLPRDTFAPVLFDLLGKQDMDLPEILALLADEIIEDLRLPLDHDAMGQSDPRRIFGDELLPRALAQIGPQRRLLLLLDECDVLDPNVQGRPFADPAANRFFGFLSDLSLQHAQLQFVFVVGRRLESLSPALRPILVASRNHTVSYLAHDEAEHLIRLAERNGSLAFAPGTVEQILALTNGHPNTTQALCQILWDHAHESGPREPPLVGVAQLDPAAEGVLKEHDGLFDDLWESLLANERIVLAALAAHPDGDALRQIGAYLEQHQLATFLRQTPVEQTLSSLYGWGVLEARGEEVRIAVELFRRWILRHKKSFVVKTEANKLDSLAAEYYRIASRQHQAGRLAEAKEMLLRTLEADSSYLNARLLLGTIYRDEGQLDQAIAEFKTARALDRSSADQYLAEVLLTRADKLERAGDGDGARAVYEEILSFARRNPTAQERSRRFDQAVALGDARKAQGDMAGAFEAYRAAGARARIDVLQRETIAARAVEAGALALAGRWAEAAAAFTWLAGNDPEHVAEWRRRAADADGEARLEQIHAFERGGEWALAVQHYRRLSDTVAPMSAELLQRVKGGAAVASLFATRPVSLTLARQVMGDLEPRLLALLIDRLAADISHRETLEALVTATGRLHTLAAEGPVEPELAERLAHANGPALRQRLETLMRAADAQPQAVLQELTELTRAHPMLREAPAGLYALWQRLTPDPTPLTTRAQTASARPVAAPAPAPAPARPQDAPARLTPARGESTVGNGAIVVLGTAVLMIIGCGLLINLYGLSRAFELTLMAPAIFCIVVLVFVGVSLLIGSLRGR